MAETRERPRLKDGSNWADVGQNCPRPEEEGIEQTTEEFTANYTAQMKPGIQRKGNG